jgi:hypothetical protein
VTVTLDSGEMFSLLYSEPIEVGPATSEAKLLGPLPASIVVVES